MANFIKAVVQNGSEFSYLEQKFSRVSETSVNDGRRDIYDYEDSAFN
jgi:hypothetical protein